MSTFDKCFLSQLTLLISFLQYFITGKLTKNGKKPKKLPGDYHQDVSLDKTNESGKIPRRKSSTGLKIDSLLFIIFFLCVK